MLVRKAHEIEWVRKSNSAKSPKDYEDRFISVSKITGYLYNGLVMPYKGASSKAKLTCIEHGDFTITIGHYEAGKGCPECGRIKSATSRKHKDDDVILKLSERCNERGDCVLVEIVGGYKKTETKNIKMRCEHGEWFTSLNRFYDQNTTSCKECALIKRTNSRRPADGIITNRIKERCNVKGYVFVEIVGGYVSSKTRNIKLYCPFCNVEFLTSHDHFINQGNGCKTCGVKKWSHSRTKELDSVVNSIKQECEKRGKSKFVCIDDGYINNKAKNIRMSCLLCKKEYKTSYFHFIYNECDCPFCFGGGYLTNTSGVLYVQKLIKDDKFLAVKFGITRKTTKERMYRQSRFSTFNHEIFYELKLDDAQQIRELENKIKKEMKGKTSYISKDDMPDGYTETVAPSELSTIMYIVKSFEKELTA